MDKIHARSASEEKLDQRAKRTVELTGRLVDNKYIVCFDKKEVRLTHTEFELLANLVQFRLKKRTGLTPPPSEMEKAALHQNMHRLRLAIDAVLGHGMGMFLITHAARSCYFLNVPPETITIDRTVDELEHHLSPQLLQTLRECRGGS
jgi:hypothetical protein